MGKVFLYYKKSGRSRKITKLVGELCYHMYRLCARLGKISSKLRRLMPTTHTSPGVLSHGSHVEMSGFQASHISTCSKSYQLLHTTSTCDNIMSRQVSCFSDFVRIFCNSEPLFSYVVSHVMTTRCSTFHVSWWIRSQYTPNIMNIIF
jgi:hypothetical protein